ncbi:MAG: DNA polymerase III subunit gamma/tau [Bacillota bacterium]
MSYLSLYRKWRSRTFSEVVGQEHIVKTLTYALEKGQTSHAYLFCGPRGTGKTTMAKLMAKALNCEAPKGAEPCNACGQCRGINSGAAMNVFEIDGASNRGIEEIRDLREKVKYVPTEGRCKVYIIDEVHMLTMEAFNALLKTLEEPPAHVVFIFATTEPHKIPATILSRCQRFDFLRFNNGEISGHLKKIAAHEGFTGEEAAFQLLAVQARGGMRDAIGLLEQAASFGQGRITLETVRRSLGLVEEETMLRLCAGIFKGEVSGVLGILKETAAGGADLWQFYQELAEFLKDLLILQTGGDNAERLVQRGAEIRGRMKDAFSREDVPAQHRALTALVKGEGELRRQADLALPLEILILRMTAENTPALKEARRTAEETCAAAAAPLEAGGKAVHVPGRQKKPGHTEPSLHAGDQSELRRIREAWPQILEILRRGKRTVHALMLEGKPAVVEKNVIRVSFPPHMEFHCENMKKNANIKILEDAILKATGSPYQVRPELERTDNNTAGGKAAPDHTVEQVFSALGGEIKEAKEGE